MFRTRQQALRQRIKQKAQPSRTLSENPNDPLQQLGFVNEASKQVRNLYIFFLAFSLYIALVVGSVSHVDLLKGTDVQLPIIGVGLPLLGFFAVVPWVYVLFYFNLLVQTKMLADKVRHLQKPLSRQRAKPILAGLHNAPILYLIARAYGHNTERWLYRLITWATLLLVPSLVLLLTQISFLPYHSEGITWSHRAAILTMLIAICFIWPQIFRQQSETRWRGIPLWLGAASLALLSLIASVPDGWLDLGPHIDKLFVRNIDVSEQVLVSRIDEPRSANLNQLKSGEAQTSGKVINRLEGLDLRGRNLRYANLSGAWLPRVDLRGADLAHVAGGQVQMQQARLRDAKLQGAVLLRAELQGADLCWANLQGAVLSSANLQGADLRLANLWGTNFGRASLEWADLRDVQFVPPSTEKIRDEAESNNWPKQARTRVAEAFERASNGILYPVQKAQAPGAIYEPSGYFAAWSHPSTEATYQANLNNYLTDLACTDRHIAAGMAQQVGGRNLMRPNLAQALLKRATDPECQPLAEGIEPYRARLEAKAKKDPS
jgi:hypothetical protein